MNNQNRSRSLQLPNSSISIISKKLFIPEYIKVILKKITY